MSSGACDRALLGWLAGCASATTVLCSFGLLGLAIVSRNDLTRFVGGSFALLVLSLILFVAICVLTAVPAAMAIWLSERFVIRSIWFFCCVGVCIAATSLSLLFEINSLSLPELGVLFGVAGFVAGLTYWRVAGRYAGHNRRFGRSET